MAFKKGKSGNPAGRRRGTPNKASAAREKAVSESGLTPLEFHLKMMRGEKIKLPNGKKHTPTIEDMKWGAKEAAPYVHPRLSSVDVATTRPARDIQSLTTAELEAIIAEGEDKPLPGDLH